MKYPIITATAAALLTMSTALHAQDAGSAPPPGSSTTTPAPSAPPAATPPAASSQFTDADLKAFARAAIAANKIQQDTTIAPTEKQPKMLAAVQAEGLDPVKFNAIAQASQSDPELTKKIQAAAAESAGAPPSQ